MKANIRFLPEILFILLITTPAWSRDLTPGTVSVDTNTFFIYGTEKSTATDSQKTDQTGIGILGHYFLDTNFGLGLLASYTEADIDGPSSFDYHLSRYQFGPSATFHIPVGADLSLQVAGSFGFATEKSTETGGTATGTYLLLTGMLNLFLNEHVSLNCGINYTRINLGQGSATEGIKNTGLYVATGFTLYFP